MVIVHSEWEACWFIKIVAPRKIQPIPMAIGEVARISRIRGASCWRDGEQFRIPSMSFRGRSWGDLGRNKGCIRRRRKRVEERIRLAGFVPRTGVLLKTSARHSSGRESPLVSRSRLLIEKYQSTTRSLRPQWEFQKVLSWRITRDRLRDRLEIPQIT